MGRAERRREQRNEQKSKTAVYNFTEEQLNTIVREKIHDELDRDRREITNKAIDSVMILLFALPLEVLKDHYWPKTGMKRLPKFMDYILEYYKKWQDEEFTIDKLEEDLWTYGGFKLEK